MSKKIIAGGIYLPAPSPAREQIFLVNALTVAMKFRSGLQFVREIMVFCIRRLSSLANESGLNFIGSPRGRSNSIRPKKGKR